MQTFKTTVSQTETASTSKFNAAIQSVQETIKEYNDNKFFQHVLQIYSCFWSLSLKFLSFKPFAQKRDHQIVAISCCHLHMDLHLLCGGRSLFTLLSKHRRTSTNWPPSVCVIRAPTQQHFIGLCRPRKWRHAAMVRSRGWREEGWEG